LAKNRYGWNKRIKEIARKMKQEDKLKRRQSKSQDKPADDTPEAVAEENAPEAVAEES
jgi:hypothetical protein